MIVHPLSPIYNEKSEILILGTFPSVKSREDEFFYAHPQNRFWRIISRIFDRELPKNNNEKKDLILSNGLALWDVIHSCEVEGSADSSINNVTPNDIEIITEKAKIKHIFLNGKKAESLYIKYIKNNIDIDYSVLPSTSPANATWSEERLFDYWNNAFSKVEK